jgi:hypothetical protein
MLVGKWQCADSKLELRADGTWFLIAGRKRPLLFDLLPVDNGKWLYTHRAKKIYKYGALAFAMPEGGRGFFVRVLAITSSRLQVVGDEGGKIGLIRLPLKSEK